MSATDNNTPTASACDTEVKDETKDTEIVEMRAENLLKHPLQNKWTLWFLKQDRSKSYEDLLNEMITFDTMEDLKNLYNNIKPPSEIKVGNDYSLFKKGIRPLRDDAANKEGGKWIFSLARNQIPYMDSLWLDVLLCLTAEAFDHSDQIYGTVINIRGKGNKISIWTADGNNKDAILEIGHKLKEALRLSRSNLEYQLHKDTIMKKRLAKPIYTI